MNGRRIAAVSVAVLALSAGAIACGGDDDGGDGDTKTFDVEGFEITFDYPGDFDLNEEVASETEAGGEAADEAGVELDEVNGVFVRKAILNQPITAENLSEFKAEADGLFTQLAGRPVEGEETEVGGLPALAYPPFEAVGGTTESTLVLDADVQYQLNCQWDTHEQEVQEACDLALSTLERKSD